MSTQIPQDKLLHYIVGTMIYCIYSWLVVYYDPVAVVTSVVLVVFYGWVVWHNFKEMKKWH